MGERGFFACFPAQDQLPGTSWLDMVRSRVGWPHPHQLARNKKSPRYAHKPIWLATIAAEVSSQVVQLTTNINCDSYHKKKKKTQTNSYSLDFRLKTNFKRAGIFPFLGYRCVYDEQGTTRNMLSALLVNEQPNRVGKIHHYCRKVMALLDALLRNHCYNWQEPREAYKIKSRKYLLSKFQEF